MSQHRTGRRRRLGRRDGRGAGEDASGAAESSFHSSKPDHKTLQLCRQVQRLLSLALADSADEVLQALVVLDVRPAPDASRLLAFVRPGPSAAATSALLIIQRLDAATPWLRAQVTRGLSRKRSPELSFTIAPPGGEVQS